MSSPRVRFYRKARCRCCQRARAALARMGLELDERDLFREPLTRSELVDLLGATDMREILNPKAALYRERRMDLVPPTREEAIRLILEDPNLLRRPVVVKGKRKLFGYEPARWRTLLAP